MLRQAMRARMTKRPGPDALSVLAIVCLGLTADGCGSAGEVPTRVELPEGGYIALAHYGTNPVVDSDEQRAVYVGLSADRASWAFVHYFLARGRRPPPAVVRVEECITAMAPTPTAPTGHAPFALTASLAASPFRPGWHALVIAVATAAARTTPPFSTAEDLHVVSDRPAGPLELALTGRGARVVHGELATLSQVVAMRPRLVLVSDGAGLGGPDAQGAQGGLLDQVERLRRDQSATVSVVARLGPGTDDALLDRVAWVGGGSYDVLVPGEERHLAERLTRAPALTNTLAEVRFDPRQVLRWRLVGHESRVARPALRQGGGMLATGDGTYLMFEVQLSRDASGQLGPLANVRVSASEGALEIAVGADAVPRGDVAMAHRAVVAIAAFAEELRGSMSADDVTWDALDHEIAGLDAPALRSELADLVRKARGLARETRVESGAWTDAARTTP